MICKVVGIKSYEKDGNINTILHLTQGWDDYSIQKGALGQQVTTEFVRGIEIDSSMIGAFIEVIYGKGFQGKAVVVDIKQINSKGEK